MCNAWNHPPDCTCGWGGEGHLGTRPGYSEGSAPGIASAYTSLRASSYTTPNALCPVCGVVVFFYSSPEGGRVFFDELGPPWPKHPCTDNGRTVLGPRENTAAHYSWQAEGWLPFVLSSMERQDSTLVAVTGHLGEAAIRFYVRHRIGREPKDLPPLSNRRPMQAKMVSPTRLLLSLLRESGREDRLLASTLSFEARDL